MVHDGWLADDETSRALASPFAAQARLLLAGYDGELVADALLDGCHVFVTENRGILNHARLIYGWGLAVMRPAELLDALEESGELQAEGNYDLVPDLLSLSHFYAIPES
ncbi:MAG TPA: hypothetical protein VFJ50_00445 [Gemmatimonadales bacterium]|nr:hypothetical protein [Gemmatimonadales bacterium]